VPARFGITYRTSENTQETPICIHRAPLGTHERFIGFLIEHFAGNFPLWLNPKQVAILPISDKYQEYAQDILRILKNYDIRALVVDRNEKIGKKIRDNEMKKIPFMLIVGEKEMEEKMVSVRKHGGQDDGKKSIEDFCRQIQDEIKLQLS
jgi:threonyl-tRNA synthetase